MKLHLPATVAEVLDALRDDPYALNSVMEFDHPILVTLDGIVRDAAAGEAPYFGGITDESDDDYSTQLPGGFNLMRGYTGQYGYRGPVMHAAEFIGGGMAWDILASPGIYVALVVDGECDDCVDAETSDDCESCMGETEPAGWAVAYRSLELCPCGPDASPNGMGGQHEMDCAPFMGAYPMPGDGFFPRR